LKDLGLKGSKELGFGRGKGQIPGVPGERVPKPMGETFVDRPKLRAKVRSGKRWPNITKSEPTGGSSRLNKQAKGKTKTTLRGLLPCSNGEKRTGGAQVEKTKGGVREKRPH